MYPDYFLLHRAHQIQNLCRQETGNRIELPPAPKRRSMTDELQALYAAIDEICRIDMEDEEKVGLFAKFSMTALLGRGKNAADDEEDAEPEKSLLTEEQRSGLLLIEEELIAHRLGSDEDTTKAATAIVTAILQDHEFFYGLKPLLLHSEEFAYEFLYPTWFNLYTAMVMPEEEDGPSRFSAEQQRAVIAFLRQWAPRAPERHRLKVQAMLAFIVNRFPAETAAEMVQRLIDLAADTSSISRNLEMLWDVTARTDKATELTERVSDFLVVQSSLFSDSVQDTFNVAQKRVVRTHYPDAIRDTLSHAELDLTKIKRYFALLTHLRALQDAHGFSTEYTELLNDNPEQVNELLQLVVAVKDDVVLENGETFRQVLELRTQDLVATIANLELDSQGMVEVAKLLPFARLVAPRFDGLAEHTLHFFESEFVQNAKNRQTMLAACSKNQDRYVLAKKLLQHAKRSEETTNFFHLLAISACMNPKTTGDSLNNILLSLRVLLAAQADQSIGRKELSDLFDDIRDSLPSSLKSLDNPLGSLAGKPERLAKLYLALCEERENYAHTGRLQNFGITKAGYSNLAKHANDS